MTNKKATTWGATGVAPFVNLDAADNALIAEATRRFSALRTPAFRAELERLWRLRKSLKVLAHSSAPSVVRNNLEGAMRAAHELLKRLEQFDGNSWLLLRRFNRAPAPLSQIMALCDGLDDALRQARATYPARGALSDKATLYFASGLAVVFEAAGVRPTSTKTGAFVQVLSVMLELQSASGHRVALQALRHRRKRLASPGLIEYDE